MAARLGQKCGGDHHDVPPACGARYGACGAGLSAFAGHALEVKGGRHACHAEK
jgi:hypothetical protein